MSMDAEFKASCDQIRKFSKRPPDADMLEIYSLYKQATVGDASSCAKSGDPIAKAKWTAWNGKKGLQKNQAKEQYIAKVKALAPLYEKK